MFSTERRERLIASLKKDPVPVTEVFLETVAEVEGNMIMLDLDNRLPKESGADKALINILLTPGINNFKQVKANPYVYYFSNLTYDSTMMKIIPETTNNLINGIFKLIDEYIDGKMICGPGGGGFLQIILKKGINPDIIKEKLKEMFGDSDICIYECEFE